MRLLLLLLGSFALLGCERAWTAADANAEQASRPAAATPFPELTGRVVDGADLLTAEQEKGLSSRQAALERLTSDQLVIVTVDSLHDRNITEYTHELGNRWGIGQAGKDNGVILLVAPNERQVRIAVGYGLEPILTDERAAEIIEQELLPFFRKAEWYSGIEAGFEAISGTLVEHAQAPRVGQ